MSAALPVTLSSPSNYKVKAVAATDQERRGPEGHRDLELQHEDTTAQRDLQDVPLEESPPSSKGKEPATVEHQRQPLSESGAGPVPAPRIGHATAVIGSRIFLFGGRAGRGLDVTPLDEAGRVWVFDTRSCTWTYLDPVAAVRGSAIVPHPVPRSYHCATATEHPRDLPSAVRKPQTWRQWAVSRKPGESRWTRVATRPFDADVYDDDDARGRPAPRGWLASAPMGDVEEGGIVMWGGLGQDDQCMGDGWILRLGD